MPRAISVAAEGEQPDVATAVIVADPIGAGYTLSQASLARALELPQSDVSVLCRAFGIADDGKLAVVVRQGKRTKIVNYHPRAIERVRKLIETPPPLADASSRSALRRVRRRLGLD